MKQNFLLLACAVCTLCCVYTCTGCRNESATDASAEVSAQQLLQLAQDKLDAKQYEEAIELFTKLAKRRPTATKHALIGDCYWKQQKLEQADVHYHQALALDPKHCGANHALGRDAVLLKKYQDSLQYLNTASEICAGTVLQAQNLRFRVEALLQLDRIDEAQTDLQKLATEFPESINTYEAGLLVATKKGDLSLAADYEEKLKAMLNAEHK